MHILHEGGRIIMKPYISLHIIILENQNEQRM